MKPRSASTVILFAATLVCSAQAGLLDASFGNDGRYLLPGMPGGSHAYSLAPGPDGSIYGYGKVLWGFGPGAVGCIFRILPQGTPDVAFGDEGVVILPFMGTYGLAYAPAMDVDGSGRIHVAASYQFPGEMDGVINRLLPNGQLDPSFGTDGAVIYGMGNGYFDVVSDMIVQPDGKVIVAGQRRNSLVSFLTIGRWDVNGTPDPSFGTDGMLLLDDVGESSWCSLVLQDDGRIVIVNNRSSLEEVDGEIIRLLADGGFDETFGVSGVFTTTGLEQPTDAVALADGSIVFVAFEEGTVGKIDGAGNWDLTFGTGGMIVPGPSRLTNIACQPDGRLLVCSYSQALMPTVFRYDQSGTIDPSFGTGGSTTLSSFFLESLVQPMMLDAQNRLLLAGAEDSQVAAAVVRLTGDNTAAIHEEVYTEHTLLGHDPVSGAFELLFNDLAATYDPWELLDLTGRPILRISPMPGAMRRPLPLPSSLAVGAYLLSSRRSALRLTIDAR